MLFHVCYIVELAKYGAIDVAQEFYKSTKDQCRFFQSTKIYDGLREVI